MWKLIKNNSVFKYFFSEKDILQEDKIVMKKKVIKLSEDALEIQNYLNSFKKQISINLLDTSSLLRKNFISIIKEGFFDNIFFIPSFVLQEVHNLSDSKNHFTRQKGKTILQNIIDLEKNKRCFVSDIKNKETIEVDYALIKLAYSIKNNLKLNVKVVTGDNNLESLCSLENINVLNINKFNFLLQQEIQKGDKIEVFLIEKGEKENQARGNTKDGTLVVVENAIDHVKKNVSVLVKRIWTTENTKIIFGDILNNKK